MSIPPVQESDIDGEPLQPVKPVAQQPAFIRSKWEEVDETELQAQGEYSDAIHFSQ